MKIRTYSTEDGHTIEFSQGVQTFALDYKPTTEVEAEWMADQLKYCFYEFRKEAWNEAIEAASENAKTQKTGNSGSWYDAGINKESILKLKK